VCSQITKEREEAMNVIIMAGGVGTRFWPMSRAQYPKQFLNIIGSHTLIEETFLRIAPLVEEQRVSVIVHKDHRERTEEIFEGRAVRIMAEPVGRNTAPCIGLGLIQIIEEYGDSPVVVLPADHYIGDTKAFQETIRAGVSLVDNGGIVTIGIVPNRPEVGYGYIKGGEAIAEGEAFRVDAFIEKPSLERVVQFLTEGHYYWNAGIFIFRAQTMMEEIRRCLPELHEGLMELRRSWGKADFEDTLKKVYEEIISVSIDYGVMENTTADVFVIPGHFPWSDVGSWRSIYELRSHEHDKDGNLVDGHAVLLDSQNTFVHARSGRLVGCVGLEDVFIIDTSDALLICHSESAQDVRRLIDLIKEKGLGKLL
jgi:mannose-1-phosphate guanylyltransferase